MSFAKPDPAEAPPRPTSSAYVHTGSRPYRRRSTSSSSIARSITWSFWWRRLLRFLFIDVLVVCVLALAFVWHCQQSLEPAALDGNTFVFFGQRYLSPEHLRLVQGAGPLDWTLVLLDGVHPRSFPLAGYLGTLMPALVVLGAIEIIYLFGLFSDIRRVRRRLQPLNDLALAAEALGSASSQGPIRADVDLSKMATLEEAIAHASVDSPTVYTGDEDLAGIEAALNGLLRQMQEAKLQQMRFVNDASHELRTPIAVIQGYVNMLDRWGKTDESVLDESIEALKLESEHMQELVEQLLFLARGDSGRNTLRLERLNMAYVVREVCDESSMIDQTHLYECAVSIADETDQRFEVVADLAMLKQSMRIIVQNAAKYSPAGSIIKLAVGADERSVSYAITDEGIGIPSSETAHLFDRFYRGSGAREGGTTGSGLGLSIAKWIVDAHGGTIEIISREGVGTRFTVHFPRS